MKLTPGKKLLLIVTLGVLLIGIPMIWVCPVISIVLAVLYAGFITFNVMLDRYCKKLIERGNLEVEERAKLNGFQVSHITPEMYNKLMKDGICDIGNNISINKKEVEFI